MASIDPHWTEILSALLTPTVAALGIYIAYRQWQTSRDQATTDRERLRHDLFDRRLSVYDAARTLIGTIMSSGTVTHEDLMKFLAGTREAKWLFDDDVAKYFDDDMWKNAIDLECLQNELEPLPVGEERMTNVKRQREIKDWFRAQYKVLDSKMGQYLRLQGD
jgi:hypothetical protein